jgi:hypothetical protein
MPHGTWRPVATVRGEGAAGVAVEVIPAAGAEVPSPEEDGAACDPPQPTVARRADDIIDSRSTRTPASLPLVA